LSQGRHLRIRLGADLVAQQVSVQLRVSDRLGSVTRCG
jgi:hypothetical protein